ncbi:phosphatase PAP2 family protein [Afifella sp. IM 167]|uniref:phosphatase PAP2 family protein n=1 Tax=Afifella sp. IM 167 TaxID=2033586 RepID=UPI001CC8F806|nr:phosphatase PAP2 family protein [Afifella sp. IM 167]MBZ8133655.1 hypothetical protein [Afifella sp. IM 167]
MPSNTPIQRIFLASIAGIAVVNVAVLLNVHFGFSFSALGRAMVPAALFAAIALLVRRFGMHKLSAGLLGVAAIGLAVQLTVPLTYGAVSAGGPLADDALMAADRAIGFDFSAWVHFVGAQPVLSAILAYAYNLFVWQVMLVPFVLGAFCGLSEALRFTLGYLLIVTVASFIAVFVPSYGAYVAAGFGPGDLAHIDLNMLLGYIPAIDDLRAGSFAVYRADAFQGLLVFPSVHAAMGVLFARSSLRVPYFGIFLVPLNLLLIASTPSHGGHFLVDTIAGVALGFATFVALDRLPSRRRTQSPADRAGKDTETPSARATRRPQAAEPAERVPA